MHYKNGNRRATKLQPPPLKLLQASKGNCDYYNIENLIVETVRDNNPDIMVMRESNLEKNNNTVETTFS